MINRRIENIASEAGIYLDRFGFGSCSDGGNPDIGRFAELIIRECADVVFRNTGPKSALNVLNHFGVQEE